MHRWVAGRNRLPGTSRWPRAAFEVVPAFYPVAGCDPLPLIHSRAASGSSAQNIESGREYSQLLTSKPLQSELSTLITQP